MPIGVKGSGEGIGGIGTGDNNRAKMSRSTQSIAGGSVWTDIDFDVVTYDFNTLSNLTTNAFTVKEAGTYILTGHTQYTSPSANVILNMRFLKNGAELDLVTESGVGSGVVNGLIGTGQYQFAIGDVLKMQVKHDGATAPFANNTYSIAKIGGNIVFGSNLLDNTSNNFIPLKQGIQYLDSPLHYDPAEDEIVSDKAIRVPPGTLYIGEQLGLKDVAGNLVYTRRFDDTTNIVMTIGFDDTGTVQEPFTTEFQPKEIKLVVQPDDSGFITSTSFQTSGISDANQFITKGYYKTGATGATQDVNFKTYLESITPDNLFGDATYPAAQFPANTEVEVLFDPPIGAFTGQTFITVISSATAFDLKADASNTNIYYAIDRQAGVFKPLATEEYVQNNKVDKFIDLTDTPNNYNVPEIQNVVVNPISQQITYKQAELSDNSDIQISAPSDGEVLVYSSTISKWVNDEPRIVSALSSFIPTQNINTWQDSPISILFVNDNSIVDVTTPGETKENDVIIVYNYNTEFGKVINITPYAGYSITGQTTYQVPTDSFAIFQLDGTDWKLGGINKLNSKEFILSEHSVTELNDVTSAGSGSIITTPERNKLASITDIGSGEIITTAERTKLGEITDTGSGEIITAAERNKLDNIAPTELWYRESATAINAAIIPVNKNPIFIKYINAVSGFSQTIPEAFVIGDNKDIFIYNETGYTVSILPDGTDLINQRADYELLPGDLVHLTSDVLSGNWIIASKSTGIRLDAGLSTIDSAKGINFSETDFTLNNDGQFRGNVASKGILVGDETTQVQTKDITFAPTDFEVTQSGEDEATITTKGITVNGNGEKKNLVFSSKFITDGSVEGTESIDLNDNKSEGLYSSVASNYSISDELQKSTGFESPLIFNYKIIAPNEFITDNSTATESSYTLEDGAYIFFSRVAIEGICTQNCQFNLILKDATSDAIILDKNGNPVAIRKLFKNGDRFDKLDIAAILDVTATTTVKLYIEATYIAEYTIIENHIVGKTSIMFQKLEEGYITGEALQQLEADLDISIEYTQYNLFGTQRTLANIIDKSIPITTITAGRILPVDGLWFLHAISSLETGITAGYVNLVDNAVGFEASLNTFFDAAESNLFKGKNLTISGTIKSDLNCKATIATWNGLPDEYTYDIITGFSGTAPYAPIAASGWTLDTANEMTWIGQATPVDVTETIEFIIPDTAFTNLAVIFWQQPDVPPATNVPVEVDIKVLDVSVTTAINEVVLAGVFEDGESALIEFADIEAFGLNSQGYDFLFYTVGTSPVAISVGDKRRSQFEGTVDVEGFAGSYTPATDYLEFKVEGDAIISGEFRVAASGGIAPGGTADCSIYIAEETAPGVWTPIGPSDYTFTLKDTDTTPTIIQYPPYKHGIINGTKLRFYARANVGNAFFMRSDNPSEYISYIRVDVEILDKTRETILNSLSLDSKGNIASTRSLAAPSGSLYAGDRGLESGARILNTKSESVGEMNAVLTQQYDGGNYYKARVVDETQVLTPVPVQIANSANNPGVETINVNYVTQGNIHIQEIAFKPFGGTLTKDFTVEFRFDILDSPVYQETIDYTTVTDFGGGLFGFNLSHPALFDLADIIHITFKDIELLGGNGYDGTDGIRQGDPLYSYFFPYLTFGAIPIVYQNIATENYVDTATRHINLSAIRTTNQLIPDTNTVLVASTIEESQNITYNNTTGVLTIDHTATYVLGSTISIGTLGVNKTVEIWIEYESSPSVWTPVPNTGFFRTYATADENEICCHREKTIPAGTNLRIVAKSNDAVNVSATTRSLSNGLIMPSIRLTIYAV
ncbi:MAG: hypothetical protein OEV44_01375 [Spirochaetota bacterium]|nr:hypothetical protein [Spirochaetota bacterium]